MFHALIDELGLSDEERRIATDLHHNGYAVIDFPDPGIEERIERIKSRLASRFDVDLGDPAAVKTAGDIRRVQDAWKFDKDVLAISANSRIIELLSKLYGRRAFPFQTLNFPVGTQQHLHSDAIHFSSIPERFMCGVWLAMEDVHADAGPLTYLPGSNRWPILDNVMIGQRGWGRKVESAQSPFEAAWDAMVRTSGKQQEVFLARKGQALIWAANLLHGGSVQNDPTRTRWSQVTHYYFADCAYFTPAFSDEPLGQLDLRTVTNIATGKVEPNMFNGEVLERWAPREQEQKKGWGLWRAVRGSTQSYPVPTDFDPDTYLKLNPDVAASGQDASQHYSIHGHREGRPYRSGR